MHDLYWLRSTKFHWVGNGLVCLSWNGKKYFIIFIDDFWQYRYLYLLQEKSQSVNIFKAFINEVEKQLDEKVKIVRLAKALTTMKNLMKIVKI